MTTATEAARKESEADGFRVEAAEQFGFETTNDDADEFKCTWAQLVNFAKACERAGMWQAQQIATDIKDNRIVTHFVRDFQSGFKHGAFVVERRLEQRMAEIDAVLGPIVEAERVRYMTSRGYVLGEDGRFIKPEQV